VESALTFPYYTRIKMKGKEDGMLAEKKFSLLPLPTFPGGCAGPGGLMEKVPLPCVGIQQQHPPTLPPPLHSTPPSTTRRTRKKKNGWISFEIFHECSSHQTQHTTERV